MPHLANVGSRNDLTLFREKKSKEENCEHLLTHGLQACDLDAQTDC
jgi:hypothetical protein